MWPRLNNNTTKEEDMDEYKIDKIIDIIKIPEDRLDAFLIELKSWAIMTKSTIDLLKICAEATGEELPRAESGMIWSDDNKNNVSINIGVKVENETL